MSQLLRAMALTLILSGAVLAQQVGEKTRPPEILEFPIHNDSIDSKQFYDQVLSRLHWTTELTQKLSRELAANDVTESSLRLGLPAISILCQLFPTAFEIETNQDGAKSLKYLRVNSKELQSDWTKQKLSLRRWLAAKSQQPLYEICGRIGFDGTAEQVHQVIVIPGLHGGEATAMQVAAAIHLRTKMPACVFRYPNDAPLQESADYLLTVLTDLNRQQPHCQIALVTHSMGGLVARAMLEKKLAGCQNCLGVHQLVMVCPPNHGSSFAEYAGVLEGAEIVQRIVQRKTGRKLLAAVLDGLNEAPSDLMPGSDFLVELNKAQRNKLVRYSIIAGDAGFVDPLVVEAGNELLSLLDNAERIAAIKDRALKLLNSPEFQKGTGDGVVEIQSAKLEGVTDFQLEAINHLDWGELDKPSGQAVLNEIVRRIGIQL